MLACAATECKIRECTTCHHIGKSLDRVRLDIILLGTREVEAEEQIVSGI